MTEGEEEEKEEGGVETDASWKRRIVLILAKRRKRVLNVFGCASSTHGMGEAGATPRLKRAGALPCKVLSESKGTLVSFRASVPPSTLPRKSHPSKRAPSCVSSTAYRVLSRVQGAA